MPHPVPILLMIRGLDIGGTERQLASVACSLDVTRFEPHVACFQDQGLRRAEIDAAGVPIVRFPVRSFRSPSLLRGALEMRRYIERHRIRLVHAFDYPAIIFGIPVARSCPSVIAVASQRYHRSLHPGWPHRLQRITDRLAHTVVVNCEYLARHMREEEHAATRIELCYNGLDMSVFHALAGARLAPLARASLVIGVVCALRPEKDVGTLLEAFACVRHLQDGMKLLVAGDGPCKADLQAQAARLGIAGDCVFLPANPEVTDYLRSIDIFVLPSRSEALSNSLMEAMACGCCAVASDAGGNPELVSDDQTGRLFPPGDAAALASVLEDLIGNDGLRQRLASEGRRTLHARFTLAASVRRMEDIYAALLARNTSTAPRVSRCPDSKSTLS
jgi:glycosyltransferase involved in cell wall biosynthesis